jgi:shikimate kinase
VRLAADDRHIVLIGLMGAGKTTVGRRLAAQLGWSFWDNDEALREATGTTAAAVQDADGQATLHRLEDQLLRRALTVRTPTVFAAAAAVVLSPGLLSDVLTVWLRITAAMEADRLVRSGQHHRPLPTDSGDYLARVAADRESLYAGIADITVDVGGDPASTCDRVVEALRERFGPATARTPRSG